MSSPTPKMGPGILGDLGKATVPATPRYAPLDRQVSNASEGSSPRKVYNPFNNPVVVESDGTDLYVMSGGTMRFFDADHAKSIYTSCVTRVSRAGVVLDVGYYSRGPRTDGTISQSFLLDMVWCEASNRMFAISAEAATGESVIYEVSRGPIAFMPLFETEANPIQMAVFGTRLFVGYDNGELLEFDTDGTFAEPSNGAELTGGIFRFAIDEDGERLYFTDFSDEAVGYVDISDNDIGAPVTNALANADRIVWGDGYAVVTTTNNQLSTIDNALAEILSVDLSGSFVLIFGVAYFDGKAYVWGMNGGGATCVVRVLLSNMAIQNTTTLDPSDDFAANDGVSDFLMPATRGAVTDPDGNAKLWFADPLFTKATISPTGRVGSVDLTDGANPVSLATSLPFSRWV